MASWLFNFLATVSLIRLCYSTFIATIGSGKSTYYGGNPSGGACGYADVPTSTFPFGYYAAAGNDIFNSGYGCGACYEITCIGPFSPNPSCVCDSSTPTVTIQVMDQCGECAGTDGGDPPHFDLDPSAMARIVGDGLSGTCGVIETTINRVSCDYSSSIKIRSKSGTSTSWYGLHIDDVAGYGAITSVLLTDATDATDSCSKGEGPSFWTCASMQIYPLTFPLTLTITNDNSEQLVLTDCITSAAGSTEFDCGINFGGTPPPVSATPTPVSATPSPTTGGPCTDLVIRNHEATQLYWKAFWIDGNICCGSITNVEVKDCCSYSSWYSFTDNTEGYYAFDNNGNAFQTPLSVRITNSNLEVLEFTDVITSLTPDEQFTTNDHFCNGPTTSPYPTTSPTDPVPTTSPTTGTPTTPLPTMDGVTCVSANPSNFGWTSSNHMILLNGVEFNMKGVAWFGFETDTFIVHGLASWANGGHDYTYYMDFLNDNGFNAVRLPFSQYLIDNNPSVPSSQVDGGTINSATFSSISALEAMDIIITELGKRGILVMLDFHSKDINSYTQGYWDITPVDAIATWTTVANRYKDYWNVFMADCFNEPHDITNAQWATWIGFCEDVGNTLIDTVGVNWLLAVQGTNSECTGDWACNWGANLQQAETSPISLNTANRYVWSPHVYGPDIGTYTYNAYTWGVQWGYLSSSSTVDAAIVIGEFGTKYTPSTSEQTWLNTFVDYLGDTIDQRDTFFWCLNTNSGDTGGLLTDNWDIPTSSDAAQWGKLTKLEELQPNPTLFTYNEGTNTVCWNPSGNVVTYAPTAPTVPTTASPSSSPITSAPVTSSPTSGYCSQTIIVKNQADSQLWWLAFFLMNEDCCNSGITSVEIKDNANYPSWTAYSSNTNGYYSWDNNGNFFSLPLSVRITNTNNDIITATDIITSFTGGNEFDTLQSFCTDSPTLTPVGTQPTAQPTDQPSNQPTDQPTGQPTDQPTTPRPTTGYPTESPVTPGTPTKSPSNPTSQPTDQPTNQPTKVPTDQPSEQPTKQPTNQPSAQPTTQPTKVPTEQPTTDQPTDQPTNQPSKQPTDQPTDQPTTSRPTESPVTPGDPTKSPSNPTSQPTNQPTSQPTAQPTKIPSQLPTSQPTNQPTAQPTNQPSNQPTNQPTGQPTSQPTNQPTTTKPTESPVNPGDPTKSPSNPTLNPTDNPTKQPTNQPTDQPTTSQPTTKQPTKSPLLPGEPTRAPTTATPTIPQPTTSPIITSTDNPTTSPVTVAPTTSESTTFITTESESDSYDDECDDSKQNNRKQIKFNIETEYEYNDNTFIVTLEIACKNAYYYAIVTLNGDIWNELWCFLISSFETSPADDDESDQRRRNLLQSNNELNDVFVEVEFDLNNALENDVFKNRDFDNQEFVDTFLLYFQQNNTISNIGYIDDNSLEMNDVSTDNGDNGVGIIKYLIIILVIIVFLIITYLVIYCIRRNKQKKINNADRNKTGTQEMIKYQNANQSQHVVMDSAEQDGFQTKVKFVDE